MNYWLIKSEPFKYSWTQFELDTRTFWDGVRNYQARNNIREMKPGDLCLFYHSNEGKEVVGIAEVASTPYPDPTSDDSKWLVVDVIPRKKLSKTVTLAQMRNEHRLNDLGLFKQPRLSVIALTDFHFNVILELAHES